jgi:TPR repeat protein
MSAADLKTRAQAGDVRAQVDWAERLDELGRHQEAVEWLARAGRAGDVLALTRLGLRLVTGLNSPFLPTDGARLLHDAAQAGGAEAAERLAVLLAGGFYVRQSFETALEFLQRAAELGSAPAREQLAILAGRDAAPPGDWPGLRRAVDIASWTAAAPVEQLSGDPRVLTVRGMASPEACAWVVGQARRRLVRAELYDPASGRATTSEETRLNRIANFGLADAQLLSVLIQARIAATMGVPLNQLEAFAVLHYAVGEEYGEHFDYLDPSIPAYAGEIARMGQRVATCLIYLNDDCEGGDTEFPQLGIRHRGAAGDALIFFSADASGRPDPRTVHAGRPPTAGEKWVLSQFVRNRPVIGVSPPRGA